MSSNWGKKSLHCFLHHDEASRHPKNRPASLVEAHRNTKRKLEADFWENQGITESDEAEVEMRYDYSCHASTHISEQSFVSCVQLKRVVPWYVSPFSVKVSVKGLGLGYTSRHTLG